MRGNKCYEEDDDEAPDHQFKYKMSMIMLKNSQKLRGSGLKVQEMWLNKDVLMIDEAIKAARKSEKGHGHGTSDLGCSGHKQQTTANYKSSCQESDLMKFKETDLSATKDILDKHKNTEAKES